jgi:hypothetical protein
MEKTTTTVEEQNAEALRRVVQVLRDDQHSVATGSVPASDVDHYLALCSEKLHHASQVLEGRSTTAAAVAAATATTAAAVAAPAAAAPAAETSLLPAPGPIDEAQAVGEEQAPEPAVNPPPYPPGVPPWHLCQDPSSGYLYYFNEVTNESRWDPPPELLAMDMQQQQQQQQQPLPPPPPPPHDDHASPSPHRHDPLVTPAASATVREDEDSARLSPTNLLSPNEPSEEHSGSDSDSIISEEESPRDSNSGGGALASITSVMTGNLTRRLNKVSGFGKRFSESIEQKLLASVGIEQTMVGDDEDEAAGADGAAAGDS